MNLWSLMGSSIPALIILVVIMSCSWGAWKYRTPPAEPKAWRAMNRAHDDRAATIGIAHHRRDRCPSCDRSVPAQALFCDGCGSAIAPDPARATAQPVTPDLLPHIPVTSQTVPLDPHYPLPARPTLYQVDGKLVDPNGTVHQFLSADMVRWHKRIQARTTDLSAMHLLLDRLDTLPNGSADWYTVRGEITTLQDRIDYARS